MIFHFAQFWIAAGLWTVSAPPALDCGPAVVSAGVVPQGRVVHLERVCRNVGTVDLSLSAPVSSCPCLVGRFDHARVQPGGKVHLDLLLDTDPLANRVELPLEFTLRAADSVNQTLVVSADVRPSVIALPEYVDMGDFRRVPIRQILIVDTTGRNFGIRQATSERSAVDVRWTPVELVRMGDHWEPASSKGAVVGFQITLQARPQPGRHSMSDEIQIELTHEMQKSLRIRVVGYSP